MTLAPARSQQSYRHEAFLWHDASDFTAGIVPFITDGLEAGEPVMVAVSAQHTKWLRDALDGQAGAEFVDIEELGRNPAQIIPAWQQFLNTRLAPRPLLLDLSDQVSTHFREGQIKVALVRGGHEVSPSR